MFAVEVYVGIGVYSVKFQQDFLLGKHLVGKVEACFVDEVAIDYPMQLLVIHSEVRIVDYVVVPQVEGHIPWHGGRQLFPVEIHRPSLV